MSTTIDVYPSRVAAPVGFIPRKDPVVYGNMRPGKSDPLSGAEVEFYQENGYLCFESLFSEKEIREFQEELHRLRDSQELKQADEVILEPESSEIRSIFAIHNSSAVFRRLAHDRRIVDRISYLLNSPLYIHQSRINYKRGVYGKEFFWHSDFETWHMEDGMPRMRAISCSISLSENNEYNGPLMLVPGSHRHFLSCVGATPENHYEQSLRKQEYGVPDAESLQWLVEQGGIVSAKGPAGSITFFECNMMHGSNSNITPWPRSNVFIVYNSVENALTAPFCGLTPRPPYIASREVEVIEPL